jgi:hypothetical protein
MSFNVSRHERGKILARDCQGAASRDTCSVSTGEYERTEPAKLRLQQAAGTIRQIRPEGIAANQLSKL